ncbi:MAG: tRNA 2-thiocytidine biosynthesis protein TtcA [Clostridia bacterium]|nr:tRNA 2-thiocytidine biosynthesis protein TtcA [Clostridia bacterium]
MPRQFTPCQQVEQTIVRRYHEQLWSPFCKAIKRYRLIRPGDRIAVCISGGKDSMLMAKMIQMLSRHTEIPFEAEYLVMDPGYAPANRQKVLENARFLEIPVTVFESDIFEIANAQEKNPCFLCARMRRGCLYKKARELGCNKIALGHHYDDVIETTLMGMLYGGQMQAMIPKLWSRNFPGMELIRPMYLIREDDVITWARSNGLDFIRCACRFTENNAHHEGGSKRQEIKQLIRELKRNNPTVEDNIFASIHTVQLDTLLSWKYKGKEHSFLDGYEDGRDGSV